MNNKPKDELKAIHYSLTGTTIKPTDTVSGAFYLRLLRDYRAYDRKQKQVLMEQQEIIERLKAENRDMKEELQRYVEIFNSIIVNCRNKDLVSRQREQITRLLGEVTQLKKRIREANINQ